MTPAERSAAIIRDLEKCCECCGNRGGCDCVDRQPKTPAEIKVLDESGRVVTVQQLLDEERRLLDWLEGLDDQVSWLKKTNAKGWLIWLFGCSNTLLGQGDTLRDAIRNAMEKETQAR
jgi:hypothetical protein